MNARRTFVGLLLSSALALSACMSGGGEGPPALPLTVADRTADPACDASWLAGVRGHVVDELGGPAEGAQIQMCLRLGDHSQVCLEPATTDVSGWFAVVIPEPARCVSNLVVRAVWTDQPAPYATAFRQTNLRPVYGVLDVAGDIEMEPIARPNAMPPMGASGEARSVAFPSGLVLEVTPDALDFPQSYDFLAAAEVPLARAPDFVLETPGVLGVHALGPELGAAPGFPVRFPETTGLPDGTRVELLLVGGIYTELAGGRIIEEGDFEPFGTGTVTGGEVVSDPGSGVPYLSWLGYRRAP